MKEGKEGIEKNNDGKRRTTGIGGRNRSNKEGIEDVKETDPFPFPTVFVVKFKSSRRLFKGGFVSPGPLSVRPYHLGKCSTCAFSHSRGADRRTECSDRFFIRV